MKYLLQVRLNGAQGELDKLPELERQAIFAEYLDVSAAGDHREAEMALING